MTKVQQVQLRQSEVRQKLNELLGVEDRTAEQTTELETLTSEAQRLEVEFRGAVAAEPPDDATTTTPAGDPEDRERMEIRERSRLSRYLSAAIAGRAVNGAESELSAAFECPGAVPLVMFETRQRQPEQRDVTPAPSTVDATLGAIVPALLQRSAAAWLGVEMPTVGVGDVSYPVLGTSVTGGPKAKSAAAAETVGSFTVTTAQPRRITGAFRFTREDAARLDGMESALRENLSSVLSDAADDQAVNGSGSADGTVNGLLNRLSNPDAPAASAESFARYTTALLSHVDGVFAVDRTGVRVLVGAQTYRHAGGVFRSNETDLSALDYAEEKFGGMRLSNRVPAAASNVQSAIVRRSNPAADRVAVMPVWEGLTLIRDEVTGAGKGEIVVTGVMLAGDVVILRPGAFVQDSFRVA